MHEDAPGQWRIIKQKFKIPAAGFSLVELLVVVVIIGILAGLILGYSGYAARKAARAKAVSELGRIENAVEEYRALFGAYPSFNGEIKAGTTFTADLGRVFAKAPAIAASASAIATNVDPWGRYYSYSNSGPYQYKLWSKGAEAGTDADDLRVGSASL